MILAKWCIKLINNVANSGNNTANTISNMGLLQSNYSMLGANALALYNMKVSNVFRIWDEKCIQVVSLPHLTLLECALRLGS